MVWLAMLAWAVAAAGLCGLAFVLLVGSALDWRERTPAKRFAGFVLGPGLAVVEEGNAAAIVALSWLTWTAAGVAAIAVVRWG